MSVVTAGILPHGAALIPGFTEEGSVEEFRRLRNSLRIASKIILRKNPDTIVIATPHNLRIKDHIGVISSEIALEVYLQEERQSKYLFEPTLNLRKRYIKSHVRKISTLSKSIT